MALDFLKVLFTYGTALVIIIGGGFLLISGAIPPDDQITKGAIIAMIGVATNWVFGETTRSSTARQTTRALLTQPAGYSVTAAEPSTVTVSPAPASETEP